MFPTHSISDWVCFILNIIITIKAIITYKYGYLFVKTKISNGYGTRQDCSMQAL